MIGGQHTDTRPKDSDARVTPEESRGDPPRKITSHANHIVKILVWKFKARISIGLLARMEIHCPANASIVFVQADGCNDKGKAPRTRIEKVNSSSKKRKRRQGEKWPRMNARLKPQHKKKKKGFPGHGANESAMIEIKQKWRGYSREAITRFADERHAKSTVNVEV